MKFFACFIVLFALLAAALALKDSVCGQEHTQLGNCRALIKSWTYVQDLNKCNEFFYTGCQGNDNRFNSQEECEAKCKE